MSMGHKVRELLVALTLFAAALPGCSGGGSNGPNCSLKEPAAAATASSWPQFRHDRRNTAHAALEATAFAALSAPKQARWVFADNDPERTTRPFRATAVIDPGGTRLYVGSMNGTVYAIQTSTGSLYEGFNLTISEPVTETALVGVQAKDGADAIYLPGNDEILYAVDSGAAELPSEWPLLLSAGSLTAPNLAHDGTVVLGSINSAFLGICPNGVVRFATPGLGASSAAAIGADDVVYFGSDGRLLYAVRTDGYQQWAFATTGPVAAPPIVEADADDTPTAAVYVADLRGAVFKVVPDGRLDSDFRLTVVQDDPTDDAGVVGPILAAPALWVPQGAPACPRTAPTPAGYGTPHAGRLYFASETGVLYAADTCTGRATVLWAETAGRPTRIVSSPAVASNAADPEDRPILVFGTVEPDDGKIYFVRDDGSAGNVLATFSIRDSHRPSAQFPSDDPTDCGDSWSEGMPARESPCAVRAAPAIGADGTVYVGSDDGRLYAIAAAGGGN